MNRINFICIGTGRCGTRSLAKMLNYWTNSDIKHEAFLMPWGEINPNIMPKLINFFMTEPGKLLRGIVSLNLLPYVNYLRDEIPNLKVLHIYRNKKAVVKSFLVAHGNISRVLEGNQERANKHASLISGVPPLAGTWDIFPHFTAKNVKESYQIYYDFYINEVAKLNNVYSFPMEWLNDNARLYQLAEYLDVPKVNVLFTKRRRWNHTGANNDTSI